MKFKPKDERAILLACAEALETLWAHYEDLANSNPGFLGKLVLQDYGLLNKALLRTNEALANWNLISKQGQSPKPPVSLSKQNKRKRSVDAHTDRRNKTLIYGGRS